MTTILLLAAVLGLSPRMQSVIDAQELLMKDLETYKRDRGEWDRKGEAFLQFDAEVKRRGAACEQAKAEEARLSPTDPAPKIDHVRRSRESTCEDFEAYDRIANKNELELKKADEALEERRAELHKMAGELEAAKSEAQRLDEERYAAQSPKEKLMADKATLDEDIARWTKDKEDIEKALAYVDNRILGCALDHSSPLCGPSSVESLQHSKDKGRARVAEINGWLAEVPTRREELRRREAALRRPSREKSRHGKLTNI